MAARPRRHGFTLLEMVMALTISGLLFALLYEALNQLSGAARNASAGASAFDEARSALGEVRRTLEQATLNPYWAVVYDTTGYPSGYRRQSDLHFLGKAAGGLFPSGRRVSGDALFFQAPLGYEADDSYPGAVLNALGYFVEWRDTNLDHPVPVDPPFPPRWRFQLRELRQPGAKLTVMLSSAAGDQWIRNALTAGDAISSIPVAENIAWMRLRFRSSNGANGKGLSYAWDSRLWDGTPPQPAESHQIPSAVDIALLALDEATAMRLGAQSSTPPPLPLAELFVDPAAFDDDLSALEGRLAGLWPQSSFRILKATITIRSAKWSLDPTIPTDDSSTEEE